MSDPRRSMRKSLSQRFLDPIRRRSRGSSAHKDERYSTEVPDNRRSYIFSEEAGNVLRRLRDGLETHTIEADELDGSSAAVESAFSGSAAVDWLAAHESEYFAANVESASGSADTDDEDTHRALREEIVAFVQLAQIRGLVSHVEGTEEFADDDSIFFVFDDEPGAALDEDALAGSGGQVTVHVLEASNVPGVDKSGTSDPYLVFACGHNNYKTAVVKKTTNPVWNEVFTWTLGAGENHSVTVDMFDHDVLGPKTHLGGFDFNVASFNDGRKYTRRSFPVMDGASGELVGAEVALMIKFEDAELLASPAAASASSTSAITGLRRTGELAQGWYSVQAVADFTPEDESEMSVVAGEILQARYHSRGKSWMLAQNARGQKGLVPASFLTHEITSRLVHIPAPWLSVDDAVLDPMDEFFTDVPVDNVYDPAAAAAFQTALEDPHSQVQWYRHKFNGREHTNFIASGDDGVAVVSVLVTEGSDTGRLYWVIVWRKRHIRYRCVGAREGVSLSLVDLLAEADPSLLATHAGRFRRVVPNDKFHGSLLRLENDEPNQTFKLGVLLAVGEQEDENEMFSNKDATPQFDQFLDLLGTRVRLKGYEGYAAQLDVKNDGSGLWSVATNYKGVEVMFHVSTLLQYDETDEQRVQRKRFIGNDIVVIIFVDGNKTYSVNTMRSQYTNVIAVVQADPEAPDEYRFAVAGKRGLRRFGPESYTTYGRDAAFVDFLLAKCLNGEKSAKQSPEFLVRERRTRGAYLQMLFDETDGVLIKRDNVVQMDDPLLHPRDIHRTAPEAVVPMAALPQFDGAIDTLDSVGNTILFGTAAGLFMTPLVPDRRGVVARGGRPAADPVRVTDLSNIAQIEIAESLGVVFVRTAPPMANVFMLSLAPLLVGETPSTTFVPCRNPELFVFVNFEGRDGVYLCVAAGTSVYIFAIVEDGSGDRDCALLETVHLAAHVVSMDGTMTGLCVGVQTDEGAEFTFFDWENFGPTPLYAPITGSTLRQLFVVDDGIVLCLNDGGIFVAADGKRDTTVNYEWTMSNPIGFNIIGPFLAVTTPVFVELFAICSGVLIERHMINTRTICHTPRDCPVIAAHLASEVNSSIIYRLDPVSSVGGMGGGRYEVVTENQVFSLCAGLDADGVDYGRDDLFPSLASGARVAKTEDDDDDDDDDDDRSRTGR